MTSRSYEHRAWQDCGLSRSEASHTTPVNKGPGAGHQLSCSEWSSVSRPWAEELSLLRLDNGHGRTINRCLPSTAVKASDASGVASRLARAQPEHRHCPSPDPAG